MIPPGMCRVITYDGLGNTPDHIVSDRLVPWEPVPVNIAFKDPISGHVRNFPPNRRWARRIKALEEYADAVE